MKGFISIEGIARRYPVKNSAKAGGTTTIFEDLWLTMQRGEFGCIIGHSGCGKTTVLNILAGLDDGVPLAVIVHLELVRIARAAPRLDVDAEAPGGVARLLLGKLADRTAPWGLRSG